MKSIERRLHAVDQFQQRHPVLAFPVAVWSKFNNDQAGNLAALISYYAFAALLPLLLILVTVLNIVLKNSPSLRDDLVTSAIAQYPVIGPHIKANLGEIPGTGLPLVIGIVFLLFGARGVAGAMQNAMSVVWGIKKEDRPGFPLAQLWSFAQVFTIGIGFVVTTFLSGVAGGVGNLINGAVAHVVTVVISLILNLGVFWLTFKMATAWRVPWRQLRTGAALAAVCWQVLQVVGGYVIGHQLQRASELYGTFGIVLGLLAWLFLQAEVTLFAAEVDAVRARHLWPTSVLPGQRGEPAGDYEDEAGEGEGEAAEGRGESAHPDGGSSLEEQPGCDGRPDAGEEAPIPRRPGEPSTSDKKAGSAR
jgi:YihY family inner membrane protein